MRIRLFILFALLSNLLSCTLLSAEEHLCFDHYTTKNGLCCDFITGIAQDSVGYLWVGTNDGLNRFDGQRFKVYSTKEGGLLRDEIRCMAKSADGEMLVGGNYGMLQSYDVMADTMADRRFPELLDSYVKSVLGFVTLRDGRDFLMTTSGVFSYDSKNGCYAKEPYLTDSTASMMVTAFYQDRRGVYWVGGFDGLHLFSPKGENLGFYALSPKNELASSIFEADSSRVLVASNVGDMWLFSVTDSSVVKVGKVSVPFRNVSVILRDSKNRVWFGTWGEGLWRMDERGEFKRIYSYSDEDDFQKVHAIYEDSEHSIWIGTQVNGLFRLQEEGNMKISHSSAMGFPKVDASCFIERGDGSMFIGSDGFGVFLTDADGKWLNEPQRLFDGLGGSILSFCKKRNNGILVSSWSGGIGNYGADGSFSILRYDGLKKTINSSKCVRVMGGDEIWVATQGDGVYVKRPDSLWHRVEFVMEDGLSDRWIDDMDESPDGTKWFVSTNGVWRCKDDAYELIKWKDTAYVPEPYSFTDGVCDAKGNFYMASNYGVAFIESGASEIQILDFLPTVKFASVFFDHSGGFWCSGAAGILRVDLEERTYKVMSLPKEKYGKLYFQSRAIYENSKGNIFFGCSNGFVVLNPKNLSVSSPVDHLAWAYLSTKRDSLYVTDRICSDEGVVLSYDNGETSVSFDVVSLSGPEVVCRYRIVGLDESWRDLDNRHVISLPSLPSGSYVLELMACKEGGETMVSKISLQLKVSTPWWGSWIFMSLLFLVLIGAGYIAYRGIMRRRSAVPMVVPEVEEPQSEEVEVVETDPLWEQVMMVVENNYGDPDFSVEELAKELAISKSTLIRKLKPLTDKTPVEIISEYRLKKADDLLRKQHVPVKEVAFRTGFSSPYYFSRKYKEFFGYPPSQNKEKE